MRKLFAALASAVLTFGLAGPTLASQPLVTPVISINQSPVSFGDPVTFTTVVPKGTRSPWISLTCYQKDAVVYAEGGPSDHIFYLGGASSQWIANGGGPAHCVAELGDLYWHGGHEYYTFLATTSFEAI